MILDKYALLYEPTDLIREWHQKIAQFKVVQSDFPQHAHLLDPLIGLSEFILVEGYAERLFPGTDPTELRISPIHNKQASIASYMRLVPLQVPESGFSMTLHHNGDITRKETGEDLMDLFVRNMQNL